MAQCANESNEQKLTLEMTDGYQLSYRYWHAEKPIAKVILLNGVMSHSQWFSPLAEELTRNNVDVIGADRRGSGLNFQDRGHAPSRKQLVCDIKQIIKTHKDQEQPLYVIGWCWGAALAINVAIDLYVNIDGLALLAPGIYPSDEVAARVKQQQDKLIEGEYSLDDICLKNPIDEKMFTNSHWLEEYILKDELRLRLITPRFFGIMMKMSANASFRLSDISCPILLLIANQDKAINNDKTLEAFGKVNMKSLNIEKFDAQHGMQFEIPETLSSAICNWIQHLETGSKQ